MKCWQITCNGKLKATQYKFKRGAINGEGPGRHALFDARHLADSAEQEDGKNKDTSLFL